MIKHTQDTHGTVYGYDADDASQALAAHRIETEGHTAYSPPAPTTTELLEQAKLKAWAEIKSERDRRKVGGVKVGSKWFHSDDTSRIQQLGLLAMGANIPANLQWKTMDGSFVTMTQTLANSVFSSAASNDQSIFSVAETHRIAMEESENPAAYDYSGGWPLIFGET